MKEIFGVLASFVYEPTPSYTVALFSKKDEAGVFCNWCGENVDKVQELTGLQEDIKEFFVIPTTLHENFLNAIAEIKREAKVEPKHYVSLGLAKKLKKAGYKQEGMVWWGKPNFSGEPDYELFLNVNPSEILHRGITLQTKRIKVSTEKPDIYDFRNYMVKGSCVAPLSTELLERLPDEIDYFELNILKKKNGFVCDYSIIEDGKNRQYHFEKSDELADTLAETWLWLRENKIL